MGKVDKNLVEYLANLSRIKLSGEETESFGKELEDVLEYVSHLNRLNTGNLVPSSHVMDMENVWREDIVEPSLSPEEILKNAPERQGNFFRVPKII